MRVSFIWTIVGIAELISGTTLLTLALRAAQGKTRVPGGTKPQRIRTLRLVGTLMVVIGIATVLGLGLGLITGR